MQSNSPSARAKDKSIRAQAVSAVTQEMSSARLKVLGDLMETRKKAEAHEQEFLRAIHTENAAFSQIVSLFENNLDEVKCELSLSADELEEKISAVVSDLALFRDSVSSNVAEEVAKFSDIVKTLKHDVGSQVGESQLFLDSLRTKLQDSVILNDKRASLLRDEIFDNFSSLEAKFNASLAELELRINCLVQAQVGMAVTQLEANMRLEHDEKAAAIVAQITHVESEFKTLEESKMEELDAKLIAFSNEFESKLSAACVPDRDLVACEEFKSEIASVESRVSGEILALKDDFFSNLNAVKAEIANVVADIPPPVDLSGVLEASVLGVTVASLVEERSNLQRQISEMNLRFSNQFLAQSESIKALSSSGHYYDWVIPNAIVRLGSLGLFEQPPSYISSEEFTVGPYRDFFFRFFPVNGTVWLVHKPSAGNSESLLPLVLDLSIGSCKRGGIRMRKVQELFGHWVWEAVFGHLAGNQLSREIFDDNLKISVEIATRQWLATNTSNPTTAQSTHIHTPTVCHQEDEIPDSPSQMSNYTFCPPDETTKRVNPFGRAATADLTPRRSSWAQFGQDTPPQTDTLTRKTSVNPFH